ncbi:carbonic anhydrase [Oceaniglobus indicus]|uniref:carbonic anhydrase n=1 Tax=Oceaniglobus indicus TaxID=2047749 RepID=UPI000C19F524|nr:carbonic anhydrase [Oceaniglobus indicus]
MDFVRPLPTFLAQRYHGWKATTFVENKAWYRRLAEEGQRPRVMVIACCDSRVHVTSIFGAEQGEFFIHRNIANLVPPYEPDGAQHGTSAAVEYAVNVLHVAHVIVLGHSNCGGVQGCYDMCSGQAPDLDQKTSFIGRWMDLLRPGFESLPEGDDAMRRTELEKRAVIVSLENLMTFPFIAEAVKAERLSLHGIWKEIAEGALLALDPETEKFIEV